MDERRIPHALQCLGRPAAVKPLHALGTGFRRSRLQPGGLFSKVFQESVTSCSPNHFFVYVQNRKSIERVTFWGVNDGDSWLNNWPVPGRRNYPLLFDRHDQPKPAFSNVIASAEKYGLLQKKGSAYDEVANP